MTKRGLEEERNYNARTGGREKLQRTDWRKRENDKARTGGRGK